MRLLSIFFLLLFFPSVNPDSHADPRVSLSSGLIEGFFTTTASGAAAHVFLGIPYARAPLGDLRFRNPVSPPPWSDVLQCKEYKSNCWQHHTTVAGEKFNGTEDCLYLNVFRGLQCSPVSPCPILYYIHGGGFDYDTPSVFPVHLLIENFASHGLIFVTVAYRLNAFGFWSSGGEEAMGNYGIHDMFHGLKWVQSEIINFGGDLNRVTIMGHSSGATAVSLLSMSPKTHGLFNQIIMMSGNGVADNSLKNDTTVYRLLAVSVNCVDSDDDSEWDTMEKRHQIVQCMRKVDEDTLGKRYLELIEVTNGNSGPRMDGPNGLFPQSLSQLISNRPSFSTLTGTAKRESSLSNYASATASTVLSQCQHDVSCIGMIDPALSQEACAGQYVQPALNRTRGCHNFSVWTVQAEREDSSFSYHSPCYKEVNSLIWKGATVYLYSFDYEKTGQEGSTPYHAFDMTYLIGIHPFLFDKRDEEIRKIYSILLANFAIYGDPTPHLVNSTDTILPKWTALNGPFGFNYYSIDIPSAEMKEDYHRNDVTFWNYVVPSLIRGKYEYTEKRVMRMNKSTQEDNTSKYIPVWLGLTFMVVIVCAMGVFIMRSCQSRIQEDISEEESQNLVKGDKTGLVYHTFPK